MTILYQSSAPGSIMLMGEHAVLRNKLALVGAIDKRITVTLTPQKNQQVDIYSGLGEYHAELHQLIDSSVFRFILASIKLYRTKINSGFRLDIHSEFSNTVGLGSSAAVVVATLACLQQWLNHADDKRLFLDARAIIQHVQGRGSGADVAASVYGGIVAYRMDPFFIEKTDNRSLSKLASVREVGEGSEHRTGVYTRVHEDSSTEPTNKFSAEVELQKRSNVFDIALIYTGYKTPTPEVIKIVDQHVQSDPEKYAKLFDEINDCSEKAWQAIQDKNSIELGKLMQQHQRAQIQLGVCDEKTAELLDILQKNPKVLGCKISGSGLGDCVVALTTPSFVWHHQRFTKIDATLSDQGVIYESS